MVSVQRKDGVTCSPSGWPSSHHRPATRPRLGNDGPAPAAGLSDAVSCGSNGWRRKDLDLAPALTNGQAWQRRERLGKHVEEHVAVQRERGAVTGTFESVLGLVVAQETPLVGAHARDG